MESVQFELGNVTKFVIVTLWDIGEEWSRFSNEEKDSMTSKKLNEESNLRCYQSKRLSIRVFYCIADSCPRLVSFDDAIGLEADGTMRHRMTLVVNNPHAVYREEIAKCFRNEWFDFEVGLYLLKVASNRGMVKALYALGIRLL
ncbi:hypothetical protein GQ457_02G022850 [Hibiscus cannabinus]